MKKFLRIKTWFVRLFSPDKKTLGAIGEDLRKVAVTAIGVGIVGEHKNVWGIPLIN
ncbi:TPA: hypothetical protein L3536_005862 [Escherichia coli]|nr:hypothetical protein [Escherichia coli]HBN7465983.1 hypothetical protein [Escherichia coli]